MLTVYKKIEKNVENLTGVDQTQNIVKSNRPFLLCIGDDNKGNFELLQNSLSLSRVHSELDSTARFKLGSFPIDFLSFGFEPDAKCQSASYELVNSLVYPYLTSKGKDFENIKKQARKMNFLSYSNGFETYHEIEASIKNMLSDDGLSQEQILEVLSQMSLTAIGAKIDNRQLATSTVYFIDVNDNVSTSKNGSFKNLLVSKGQNSLYGSFQKNILYIFNGTGNHDLSNYLSNSTLSRGGLSTTLSYFLSNSTRGFLPISSNGVSAALADSHDEVKTSDEVIRGLDGKLFYNGAHKYTDEELRLRNELDLACVRLMENFNNSSFNGKINSILEEVKKRCSDSTYYQILSTIGMMDDVDKSILARKSDREIIEAIEELFAIDKKSTNTPKKMVKKDDKKPNA